MKNYPSSTKDSKRNKINYFYRMKYKKKRKSKSKTTKRRSSKTPKKTCSLRRCSIYSRVTKHNLSMIFNKPLRNSTRKSIATKHLKGFLII